MKKKVSISMEESTIEKCVKFISNGSFRNKSHLIEFAVDKYMEDNKYDDNR